MLCAIYSITLKFPLTQRYTFDFKVYFTLVGKELSNTDKVFRVPMHHIEKETKISLFIF